MRLPRARSQDQVPPLAVQLITRVALAAAASRTACLPADRHRCSSLDRALLQTSDRWGRQTVPSPSRILYLLQHIVAYITGQNCDTMHLHLQCTARQCHFFSVERCGRQVAPVAVIQSTVNDYQCDRGGGCVACWIA